MSVTEKYIPLIDEVILRNPVAVRLNAIRLGLGDEGFQLSRQSLMVSIAQWQKDNNATEQRIADMIREVLSVESALHVASEELLKTNKPKEDLPQWLSWLTLFLLFLGVFTAFSGAFKLIRKMIS